MHAIRYAPVILMLCATAAQAMDEIPLPAVAAGDKYIYRQTAEVGSRWQESRDELVVQRVSSESIFLGIRPAGSDKSFRDIVVGRDWSLRRAFNGKEAVTYKPADFPLTPNKSWRVQYEDPSPAPGVKLAAQDFTCKAIGLQAIEVPAGKFQAVKVECEGQWRNVFLPSQQGSTINQPGQVAAQVLTRGEREVTGRIYREYWYVPEVKRWVRSVDEMYSAEGVRSHRTRMELESYTPAP